MSWVSTAIYYDRINRAVGAALGGRHSAPLLIESFDFDPIARGQAAGEWEALGDRLAAAAARLEAAGAEGLLLCTNTMHKLHDRIAAEIAIPILHIADATAEAMKAEGAMQAVLLGTRFTMTEAFFIERVSARGVRLSAPDPEDIDEIDRIIFEELVRGETPVTARRTLKTLIAKLARQGARAIVLGCTELGMIVDTRANILTVFDTTIIHAQAAARWILDEQSARTCVEVEVLAAAGQGA